MRYQRRVVFCNFHKKKSAHPFFAYKIVFFLLQFSRRDLLRALGFAASLLLLVWAVGAYEAWAREQEVKRWEDERGRWGP